MRKADVAVWPIRFSGGSQDLTELYDTMELQTQQIQAFLKGEGFKAEEITTVLQSLQINTPSNTAVMPMLPALYRASDHYGLYPQY